MGKSQMIEDLHLAIIIKMLVQFWAEYKKDILQKNWEFLLSNHGFCVVYLEYFFHSEHYFSETLMNRREFQRTMISFHGSENSDERISMHLFSDKIFKSMCLNTF